MKNVLIIGAGGVGGAVAHKCAQNNDVLGDICIASRTLGKCDQIVRDIDEMGNRKDSSARLHAAKIDAKDDTALAELISQTRSNVVINVGSPFCNMSIMEACLRTGAHYLDTAVYEVEGGINEEPPWYANYEWKQRERFEKANVTGVLGIGFDPGAVNAFCAHVHKHLIDDIETIDIMDVNAGSHGRYFATNFDPETNLREIMEDAIYWEDGKWARVPCHSKSRTYDFPVVGTHQLFSMGHDELHSLAVNIPAKRIEFWMAFGEQYLKVFDVLHRLGLLSNQPVIVNGQPVEPIKLVKAVLPEPASLAPGYTGKTCIGCLVKGTKDGRPREVFIYNVCDHEACYAEVGSQGISYTTAVPVVTAARLIVEGPWNVGKLVNVEELDPDPFMSLMPQLGLDWEVRES